MLLISIDTTPSQTFGLSIDGATAKFTLRYRNLNWFFDLSYKNKNFFGIRVVCGAFLLFGSNLPFDIYVDDKGLDLDPFFIDSFSKYFDFTIIEKDEMEQIRGYKVG